MGIALELARKGVGKTLPNPMVGAVAVKGGKIIGKGYHRAFGRPHAECGALRGVPSGATLYVSLEPCMKFEGKKTPSCSELLLKKGVRRVYVAHEDPNPEVSGKGIAWLRRHGVEVHVGLESNAAQVLNCVYLKNVSSALPFIAVKMASSLDGRIATSTGASRWITGDSSRKHVHQLRSEFDALLTTSKTVIADNPHLTVRHVKGSNPLRIVLDRSLKTDADARVYKDKNVLLVTSARKKAEFTDKGVEILKVPSFDLHDIFHTLYLRGIHSVLVEAGGTFVSSLFQEKLVDYSYTFLAPLFLGSKGVPSVQALKVKELHEAVKLESIKSQMFEHDILVEGFVRYSPV